jgi:hypothetical protein
MPWTEFFETAAKFAPLATASIAVIAAATALTAVYVQRDIARRRAAIDFFLKTETDKEMVELYERFKIIDTTALRSMPIPTLIDTTQYKDARRFLNICELIAVGVRYNAFSDRISYAYWCDVILNSYKRMEPLIKDIRAVEGEGGPETYIDLQRLCNDWKMR